MSNQYTLLAVNDEQTVCEVCGKVELKKVMWLAPLNEDGGIDGEAFAVGTTCGAKMLKTTYGKLQTRVKTHAHLVYVKKEQLIREHPLTAIAKQCLEGMDELKRQGLKFSFSERMAHPLMVKYFTMKEQVESEVNAIEIVIAL